MIIRKWAVLFSVLVWLISGATRAEEQADADNELLSTLQQDIDKFGKLATDTKQNVDYMPYVVSTLHGEDLYTLGVENLREALQLIPGVDLSVGMAGVRNPIFRGSNPFAFGQSKLIIDGMVVNDQIFGGYNQYLDMPVRLIHRIEVVRGPGSLLNHVNGYAGSIHVITRANRDDGLRPESEAFVSAGSNNYGMVGTVVAGKLGGMAVSADAYALKHDLHSDPTVDRFNRTGSADQSLENYNAGFNLNQNGFHFKARLSDNNSGVSYGQSFSLSDDPSDYLEVRNAMFDLGYQTDVTTGIATDVSLGYLDEDRILQNKVMPDGINMMLPNGRYFLVDYSEKTLRGKAELKITRLQDHTFTLGALIENTSIGKNTGRTSDNDLTSFTSFQLMNTDYRRHVSVYADDLWNMSEQLAIQAGVKADNYNDVDNQLSPRLAMVYRHDDDHIYKLMYSKSYRDPSWREQYLNSSMAFYLPNPSLDLESVAAYEAAYIHKFSATEQFKFNLFLLRNSSQIYAANGMSAYTNNPDTQLTGFEIEASTAVGFAGQLTANYSFVDGDNVVDSLANSTRNMFKAAYRHNLTDTWSLASVLAYIGEKDRVITDNRNDVDSYVTLDLSTRYRNKQSGTSVSFSIKNALDEDYALPAPAGTYVEDLVQPGRTVLFSVTQEF